MSQKRKDVLLRAAYDLLKKSQTHYVQEAIRITVFYDDADCDGYCLMDDIATEIDLDDDEEPLSRDQAQQRETDARIAEEVERQRGEADA